MGLTTKVLSLAFTAACTGNIIPVSSATVTHPSFMLMFPQYMAGFSGDGLTN
jgi:hypothetical protein